jgi:hypothetical protein
LITAERDGGVPLPDVISRELTFKLGLANQECE